MKHASMMGKNATSEKDIKKFFFFTKKDRKNVSHKEKSNGEEESSVKQAALSTYRSALKAKQSKKELHGKELGRKNYEKVCGATVKHIATLKAEVAKWKKKYKDEKKAAASAKANEAIIEGKFRKAKGKWKGKERHEKHEIHDLKAAANKTHSKLIAAFGSTKKWKHKENQEKLELKKLNAAANATRMSLRTAWATDKRDKRWKGKEVKQKAELKKLRAVDGKALKTMKTTAGKWQSKAAERRAKTKALQGKSGELATKRQGAVNNAKKLLEQAKHNEKEVKNLRAKMAKGNAELKKKKSALSREMATCVASGVEKQRKEQNAKSKAKAIKNAIAQARKQAKGLSAGQLQKKIKSMSGGLSGDSRRRQSSHRSSDGRRRRSSRRRK